MASAVTALRVWINYIIPVYDITDKAYKHIYLINCEGMQSQKELKIEISQAFELF